MEDEGLPGPSSRRAPLQRWGDLKPAPAPLPCKLQVSVHQKAPSTAHPSLGQIHISFLQNPPGAEKGAPILHAGMFMEIDTSPRHDHQHRRALRLRLVSISRETQEHSLPTHEHSSLSPVDPQTLTGGDAVPSEGTSHLLTAGCSPLLMASLILQVRAKPVLPRKANPNLPASPNLHLPLPPWPVFMGRTGSVIAHG